MTNLDCNVNSCGYNQDQCCCKGDIMVGGRQAKKTDDTCCDSFTERKEDSYSNALCHPSKTISIDCEAENCEYNSNYKCRAEHVDIKGCGACDCKQTACGTFKEKC